MALLTTMRINHLHTIGLITLCLATIVTPHDIKGQGRKPQIPNENVTLLSDRTTYIVGESILFSTITTIHDSTNCYEPNKPTVSLKHSDVSYVELINSTGEKISVGKYPITGNISAGSLAIPNNIITGNYYLRAYTKFMRNNGPYAYSYLLIKIINPYKEEVMPTNKKDSLNNYIKDSLSITKSNTKAITTDKNEYSTREKVTIKINESELKKRMLQGLCISVVPEQSFKPMNLSFKNEEQIRRIEYQPESQGISITGKLVNNNSNDILPFNKIDLSILDNERDFFSVITDSTGRFFFSLPPLKGAGDIFLYAESSDGKKNKILIDNEFCRAKINLPSPRFDLSMDEKVTVYNLAINVQAEQFFRKLTQPELSAKVINPFYGKPTMVLFIDQYIQLPTIEDYINELLPIKVTRSHGKESLRLNNTTSGLSLEPLVLLDLVVIEDLNKILSLTPNGISRIEVVNEPHIRGDITYPGIVSIFSNKDDYASLSLPQSGVLLNFNFFTKSTLPPQNIIYSSNQPDTRNTLYWNPNVIIGNNYEKDISFSTSDTPGKYIVLLRGLLENGELYYSSSTFTVK